MNLALKKVLLRASLINCLNAQWVFINRTTHLDDQDHADLVNAIIREEEQITIAIERLLQVEELQTERFYSEVLEFLAISKRIRIHKHIARSDGNELIQHSIETRTKIVKELSMD